MDEAAAVNQDSWRTETAAAFGRVAEAYDAPPVDTPTLTVTLAREDWRLILKRDEPAGSDD